MYIHAYTCLCMTCTYIHIHKHTMCMHTSIQIHPTAPPQPIHTPAEPYMYTHGCIHGFFCLVFSPVYESVWDYITRSHTRIYVCIYIHTYIHSNTFALTYVICRLPRRRECTCTLVCLVQWAQILLRRRYVVHGRLEVNHWNRR